MAYNLGALVTEVQTKSKDSTFSASLIKTYIQDTIDEVLGRHRFSFSEQTLTATIADPATSYTFASTVQTITDFTYTTAADTTQAYRPQYLPYREFLENYPDYATRTAGLPYYFTLYSNKIIFPAPLSEDIAVSILYILASPTLDDDADVPVIPVEFKQILVRGALAGIEEYRENYDQAAIHRRKVEDLTEDMLQRYGARQFVKTSKASLNRRRNGQESAWV